MIDKALEVLKNSAKDYLLGLPNPVSGSEDPIKLSPVLNDKNETQKQENSLLMSLINIEEERVVKSQKATMEVNGNRIAYINPPIKLNLFVLISANFTTYESGLEYLSGVIKYFQSKSVFNHDNTPSLDSSIEKLIIELYSLSFEQQNHLWGALGAKYVPSVVYKVRMLTVQEALKKDEVPSIEDIKLDDGSI